MNECAHAPCHCEVENRGSCCSDACRESLRAGSLEASCPCGHVECQ